MAIILISCGLTSCGKASESASVPSTLPASPTASVAPLPTLSVSPLPIPSIPTSNSADSTVISTNGFGAAQLGMTLGALKQRLGNKVEFVVTSPFIVDFDAIAVRKEGKIQYYILYLAGQSMTDNDVIQGLLTNDVQFRTAEGVGPGTPIKQAAEKYGKATLSYNTQNESREYVRFDHQPAQNVSFGTGNAGKYLAGIYPSPTTEYNETQTYKEDAVIQSVLMVCLSQACVQPSSSPITPASPSSTMSPSSSPSP